MFNVPSEVWNQIAADLPDLPVDLKRAMELDDKQLTRAMDRQATYLERLGYPNKVVLAYQNIQASLLAGVMLEAYLYEKGMQDLIPAIPVVDADQLPALMQAEYAMLPPVLRQFNKALRDPKAHETLKKSLPKP